MYMNYILHRIHSNSRSRYTVAVGDGYSKRKVLTKQQPEMSLGGARAVVYQVAKHLYELENVITA